VILVRRARGAKSLTFPGVPVALIWRPADPAFSPAASRQNAKNLGKEKEKRSSVSPKKIVHLTLKRPAILLHPELSHMN